MAALQNGAYPVNNLSQAVSAIKLRHNSKSIEPDKILDHVLRACWDLSKWGRISPGALRRIQQQVAQARLSDKRS